MCDAIGDELFYQKGRFITPLQSKDMEKLAHECETALHDFKVILLQKESYTKSKLLTDISLKIHEANMLDIKKSNMESYEEKKTFYLSHYNCERKSNSRPMHSPNREKHESIPGV